MGKFPMNNDELETMRTSFQKLNERRIELLKDPQIMDLRERVKKIRKESIRNMGDLLEKVQKTFESNGIQVFLAENDQKAVEIIYEFVQSEFIIAKSKSNTVNEIGLHDFLL